MKHKRFIHTIRSVLIFILLTVHTSHAAFEDLAISTAHSAMAGAGVAFLHGPASLFINPALLHNIKGMATGYYHPFQIKEISTINFALCYPIKNSTTGLTASSFGNKYYGEQQFQLFFSKSITSTLSLAASICAGNIYIKNYGMDWTFWINVACVYRFSEKLQCATVIKNVNYATIGQEKEHIPQIIHSGISYAMHARVHLNLDVYKDNFYPMDILGGVSLQPHKSLHIRMGIAGDPSRVAAGFSLLFSNYCIDYAYIDKTDLGATHLFTVQFYTRSK